MPPRVLEITEKTPIKMSYTILIALGAALLALSASAYGMRDGVVKDMRAATTEQLKAYVTHEEFLQWQIQESDKRDRQFRQLLGLLDQIRKK